MEDWSGTVYGPTTHGPVSRRKSPSRTAPVNAETAAEPTTPRPRKSTAATKSTEASTAKPGATTNFAAGAPVKRSPRKAATAPVDVIDDLLLADLDLVLADQPPQPVPTPAVPAPPTSPDRPALSDQPPLSDRPPMWARLVAEPGQTPEHVVREALLRLGSQAREWVDHTRARYPQARADALARLAVEEHVRTARRQALANTSAVGSLAEVGLLGRTQASLMLTIAAVYGADPTAEERVRDLLELLRIPRLTQPSLAAAGDVGRVLSAVAVRRIGARLIPFGAAVAGVIHSGRTTEDVAMRAISRFRPRPAARAPR